MNGDDRAAAHQVGAAPECQVCPLCMGMAALRQSRPEAMEHLLKAGSELLLAARVLLEPAPGRGRRPAPRGGMQRIDIA